MEGFSEALYTRCDIENALKRLSHEEFVIANTVRSEGQDAFREAVSYIEFGAVVERLYTILNIEGTY